MAFLDYVYSDWRTISIAAAAFSVVAATMVLMLSRLFSLRNLEQIAKTEFVFAASTVLIVIMTVTIIQVVEPLLAGGLEHRQSIAECLYLSTFQLDCDSVRMPATASTPTTLIDWMKLYLTTPASCVQKFMSVLYSLSIPIEAMTSVYMEIFMSEHASGFGVKWISERITNAVQSLSFYVYIHFLLVHMLDFIKYYSGFFFSVGVALRAFPPTRGAGAYMMTMAFGLYFVLPLSYVLIATVSLPHVQSSVVSAQGLPTGSSFQYTCILPEYQDVGAYACDAPSVARAFELRDRIEANADSLEDMLSFRLADFTRHLVSAICVTPMVALVILLTFVLNTTNLFGGNIPEIGRGLVKLI